MEFNEIDLKGQPLNLEHTFTCGQAFRWKKNNNTWTGVINNKLYILTETNNTLIWKSIPEGKNNSQLMHYLRLDEDINKIYSNLIKNDSDMERLIDKFYGIRLLKQDLHETIFSFLCSSANSIPKISVGIENMSKLFPENKICTYISQDYYGFPTLNQLADTKPNRLREIKELAFRGRNIWETANILQKENGFYDTITNSTYANAFELLSNKKNIGYKITDCICLFSLGFDHVVPVDTHVRQIAIKKFNFSCNTKSISPKNYRTIQKLFTDTYGDYAGWAQQFLFMQEIN